MLRRSLRSLHSTPSGGTTNDFLMNGGDDEVVSAQLTDKELLNQFKEVEKLNQEDKHLVKTFIDAFLTKRHIQKLAST
jgi:hypothetical protein